MKYLAILLLASVGALGQQGGSGTVNMDCPPHQVCVSSLATSGRLVEDAQKPLKCNKYERIENPIADFCARNPELINKTNRWMCESHASDYCAPIMHEVTEEEWQELMERLKWLHQEVLCAKDPKCAIADSTKEKPQP